MWLRTRPWPRGSALPQQRSGSEEAVNDSTVYHIVVTISFIRRCNVRASRGTSWRSHHDLLLLGDGFCAQEFVVEVRTFGVSPSVELLRKVEPKDVHLPSKNTPIRQKNGGLPRSAVARPAQQVHTIGVPPDLSYFLASTSNTKRSRLQAS